jgi:hypothetical protein
MPANLSALGSVNLNFNPLLVGGVPSGVASVLSTACCGSYALLGTSVGLDTPLPYILAQVKAALDPSNAVLQNWNPTTTLQPCASTGGPPGRAVYTASQWTGIGCTANGTVPAALQQLRTFTSIDLSTNSLGGTLPAWTNLSSAYFGSTLGFDATTTLYFYINNISGTLPASLGTMPQVASTNLALCTNLFQGTVPASYANFNNLALCQNPLLVGTIPAGTTLWPVCSYYLRGTSIGLDRPLPYILSDIKSALVDSGNQLASWNTSVTLQVCSGSGTAGYQSYGAATWAGLTCRDYASPATFYANAYSLGLRNYGLAGSVATQLQQLRTFTSIDLSYNLLAGTLPTWCAARACVAPAAPGRPGHGRGYVSSALCAQLLRSCCDVADEVSSASKRLVPD